MMMDLARLSARAMQIRRRFADLERARNGREWTREEIMQGLVVDVGALMKLVMAKAGARHVDDADQKLAHELSDCLWSVLVLYQLYGLDAGQEFTKAMDALERNLIAQTEAAPRRARPRPRKRT